MRGRSEPQNRASHRNKKARFASQQLPKWKLLCSEKYDIHVLSYFLKITPRRIQQLVKRGVIPKGERRGEYDLITCIHAYIVHLHNLLYGFSGMYWTRAGENDNLILPPRGAAGSGPADKEIDPKLPGFIEDIFDSADPQDRAI